MHKIEGHTTPRHFIAHDGKGGIHHFGVVQPGQVMKTGQAVLEDMDTPDKWTDRAVALGFASKKKADHDLIPAKDKEKMDYQMIAVESKKLAVKKAEIEAEELKGKGK